MKFSTILATFILWGITAQSFADVCEASNFALNKRDLLSQCETQARNSSSPKFFGSGSFGNVCRSKNHHFAIKFARKEKNEVNYTGAFGSLKTEIKNMRYFKGHHDIIQQYEDECYYSPSNGDIIFKTLYYPLQFRSFSK